MLGEWLLINVRLVLLFFLFFLEALAVGLEVLMLTMASCGFFFSLHLEVVVIVVFNVVVGHIFNNS